MCEDGISRHHALRVLNNNFICGFQVAQLIKILIIE